MTIDPIVRMKLTCLAALCAALMAIPVVAEATPNIVLLYADDMGYGDLGVNNPASKIPTPNLDRLAAEGTRFTDAHSSSGICTPSRYAMLTGRHHWRDFHNIVGPFDASVFKKDQLTLPAMLRDKGYTTACIGKWHLGFDWDSIRKPGSPPKSILHSDFDWTKPFTGGPLDHGFDHYFGDNVINFPPYAWIEDDRLVLPPDTTLKLPPGKPKEGNWECRPGPARSDWDFHQVLPTLTHKAVEYVRSQKGKQKPFFLFMAFPSPHAPIIPNDEFDGKSKAGPYGDWVVQTDDACGQILTALHEAGLEDNTIVIFSSDNGPEIYANERDRKYDHWSSEPFRGLKQDIYEGGHHIPFLVKWPGVTKPATVSGALISQIDLMATFAALVNYELPRNSAEDSYDFLPFLRGQAAGPPRTTMVHNTYNNAYAIRHHDWLLVNSKTGYARPAPMAWLKMHNTPAGHDQPVELFNLKDDPGQRQNLAAEHPDTVADLQALLKKIREDGHSAPRLATSD